MDKQTTLENWEKFSMHMYQTYLPRTIGKYGDSRLEDVTSQDTRYWNIIRYATRLMAGRGKAHDLEKIVHYAQMAWQYERTHEVNEVKADGQCVVPGCNRGVAEIGGTLCAQCMLQAGEDDGYTD